MYSLVRVLAWTAPESGNMEREICAKPSNTPCEICVAAHSSYDVSFRRDEADLQLGLRARRLREHWTAMSVRQLQQTERRRNKQTRE